MTINGNRKNMEITRKEFERIRNLKTLYGATH